MSVTTWVRSGLVAAGAVAIAGSGTLVACTVGGTVTTNDAGLIDATPDRGPVPLPVFDSGPDPDPPPPLFDSGPEPGPQDAGKDTGDAAKPQPAHLILINGVYDMGAGSPHEVGVVSNPLAGWGRICYEITGAGIAGTDPLPGAAAAGQNGVAGVPIGGGINMPSSGVPLSAIELTPYLLSAQALQARGVTGDNGPFNCTQLLGAKGDGVGAHAFPGQGGPLVLGVHFWKLRTIPKGTLKDDATFVMLLTGCAADSTGGTANCGADFTGVAHNFKASIIQVDRTAPAADELAVQLINGTTSAGTASLVPAFVDPNVGTPKPLSGGVPIVFDNAVPASGKAAPPLVKVKGVSAATDDLVMGTDVGSGAQLAIPLSLVSSLSDTQYVDGKSYTFVAVGTPGSPGGAPLVDNGVVNLRALHFLGFRNSP